MSRAGGGRLLPTRERFDLNFFRVSGGIGTSDLCARSRTGFYVDNLLHSVSRVTSMPGLDSLHRRSFVPVDRHVTCPWGQPPI